MAQVVQPKVSGDAETDSWAFEVTNRLGNLDQARSAAAVLADLPSDATLAQTITRLNQIKNILAEL